MNLIVKTVLASCFFVLVTLEIEWNEKAVKIEKYEGQPYENH